jgi:MFS family permease
MVCGLGAAWILDGLQITIASSVTGQLTKPQTLDMTSTKVGLIASIYLVGEMIGALVFGRMSDKLGRRRRLITTLLSPIAATPWRRRDASHARLTRPAPRRHPEVRSSGLM